MAAVVLDDVVFASGSLAETLLIAATQMELAEEGRFPAPDEGYNACIYGAAYAHPGLDASREMVRLTAQPSPPEPIFSITRAQEGTSAKQWAAGSKILAAPGNKFIGDLRAVLADLLHYPVEGWAAWTWANQTTPEEMGFWTDQFTTLHGPARLTGLGEAWITRVKAWVYPAQYTAGTLTVKGYRNDTEFASFTFSAGDPLYKTVNIDRGEVSVGGWPRIEFKWTSTSDLAPTNTNHVSVALEVSP